MKQIETIFNEYWCRNSKLFFAKDRENESIYNLVIVEADKIEIENKLILYMAIRLLAESYMIDKFITDVPRGNDIIQKIYLKKNQSSFLIKAYRKHINDKAMNTLELVAMITPENTHLNSFMFELILDMSVRQLFKLYQEVKILKV